MLANKPSHMITMKTAAAITAFGPVTQDAASLAIPCVDEDDAIGVSQDKALASGEIISVADSGEVIVVASEAIGVDELVVPAGAGKVKALPGEAGTYTVLGRARTAAGEDGDWVLVLLEKRVVTVEAEAPAPAPG